MNTARPDPRDAQALLAPHTVRPPLDRLVRRAGARGLPAIPLALALVVISTFFPEELSFYILGLRLTVTRLILLLLAPILLVKLTEKISAGRYRFVLSDLFVPLAGFWMIYAPAVTQGVDVSLNHAGPIALEFCIGYLATRTLLSKHGQALAFADLLCRVIAIVGLLALLDPLTGHYFIHSLAAELTGYGHVVINWSDAYRLGVLRAFGPVEHPIFLGLVCGISLLIAATIAVRWRAFVFVACSMGLAAAISSAPIQAVVMGFGLLMYNRLLVGVRLRWLVLIAAGAVATAAAFMISNSPVGFIISHMTFEPSSGYYRTWIWANVIDAVNLSPWYGLGFGPYPEYLEINHSVDSLWLVTAELFGLPGAILIALSMIGAVSLRVEGRKVNLSVAESRLGTAVGVILFLIIFLSFTVDLWGSVWILTALLIGLRAHLGELGRLKPMAAPPRRKPLPP